ncbi:MAG: YdbL family protein [Opitutae bacterium]|nr:YdbL family protein [Opitutae bacterium]
MITRLFTLCLALCALTVTAFAESGAEIQRRMAQRLPALDALKAKELVGENNRGFVETRAAADAAASTLVSDENRDREQVYALIARETGASADAVGRARAKQIAANSRSGVWVQDERGNWAKK